MENVRDMRQVEELRKACEKEFGKAADSPSDFNELNLRIKKKVGRTVSVSSLKRIWGYVPYPHTPSNEILSILSAYVGYKDWHDFRNSDGIIESSGFLGKDIVRTSGLKKGSRVEICWKPDRRCIVEFTGGSEFRVVEAENSKLRTGDIFSCGVMAKGEPLVCHEVRRGGELLAEGYVAGKTDGVTSLKITE